MADPSAHINGSGAAGGNATGGSAPGGGGGTVKPNQSGSGRAPRSGGVEAGGVGAVGGGGGGPTAGATAGSAAGVAAMAAAAAAAEQTRRDRTVTALCFHQYNGDVLAVGYGAFFFSPSVHKGGAVLFWSVRRCDTTMRKAFLRREEYIVLECTKRIICVLP